MELLISEGHHFSDVRHYSLPQLVLFLNLRAQRLKKEAEAYKEAMKGGGRTRDGNVERRQVAVPARGSR